MFDLQADPFETLDLDECLDILQLPVLQDDYDWSAAYN